MHDGLIKFSQGLDRRPANYTALTPNRHLDTATANFPDRIACIYGKRQYTYREFGRRCCRLASALKKHGIGPGDVVALMAPNIPEALEAHYGIPMAGGVINPLNIRLDPSAIGFILNHGEAKIVLTDTEFASTIRAAIKHCDSPPKIIDIEDDTVNNGERLGELTYNELLEQGDPNFVAELPVNEWDPFALSYTSGTTGDPKGVVFHHRGGYVMPYGQISVWTMPPKPVYLWTLPMFHSLGWGFPWTISILGGTHVMLRRLDPADVFRSVAEHKVTNLCAAPTVLNMVINAPKDQRSEFAHTVNVMTAGSAPPPTVLDAMEKLGFDVVHAYGLTECFGCVAICHWQEDWATLSKDEQARLKARQGLKYPQFDQMIVADPKTMTPVPQDGETVGEVMTQGSTIMRGYLKNPSATENALSNGWFRTGDLAVVHHDGYIQIKDRSKDIIISGGENISSIEVESILYKHPGVLEAAVVARPHDHWGETPCAFVTLRDGKQTSEQDIIDFCRDNLAHFKCPKSIVFGELPKTATGKIQKFQLREQLKEIQT